MAHAGDHDEVGLNAKAHFANVNLRDYDSIFSGKVIPNVLRAGSKGKFKPIRFLQAFLFILGIFLNTLNIGKGMQRNLPAQKLWVGRAMDGSMQTDYAECKVDTEEFTDEACKRWFSDKEAIMSSILAWCELAMLGVCLAQAIWKLWNLRKARVDITSPENAKRWINISQGFAMLEDASSVSALKMLPGIKTMPSECVNHLKLQKMKLSEDDGEFSIGDKIWIGMLLVMYAFLFLVFTVAGVFALYLKLNSLEYLNDVRIGRWDRARWLAMLGFANQVAGLVPMGKVKKTEILFVVFTGEDAEMQTHEWQAMQEFNGMMYKHIFCWCGGLKGFVAALTVSATDIQKMVITEGDDDEKENGNDTKKEK